MKIGLSDIPVMCKTIERTETDHCDWYSCGEWCLSKVKISHFLLKINNNLKKSLHLSYKTHLGHLKSSFRVVTA